MSEAEETTELSEELKLIMDSLNTNENILTKEVTNWRKFYGTAGEEIAGFRQTNTQLL